MVTKAKPAEYAEVAPAVPLPGAGKQTYTYRIPAAAKKNISLFSEVGIPLGKRSVKGFVVDLHSKAVRFPTKMLTAPNSVQLTAYQVAFAQWIARSMHGGLGYTLRMFLPPRRQKRVLATPPSSVSAATTPLTLAVINRRRDMRWKELNQLVKGVVNSGAQVLVVVAE